MLRAERIFCFFASSSTGTNVNSYKSCTSVFSFYYHVTNLNCMPVSPYVLGADLEMQMIIMSKNNLAEKIKSCVLGRLTEVFLLFVPENVGHLVNHIISILVCFDFHQNNEVIAISGCI